MSYDPSYPDLYDYAIVDPNGLVVNVTLWDGGATDWTPPDGCTLVALPYVTEDEGYRRYTAGIGWTYRDGQFIDERPPAEFEDDA